MRKNKKRSMSVALAVLMIALLLAGCGAKSENAVGTGSAETAVAPASPPMMHDVSNKDMVYTTSSQEAPRASTSYSGGNSSIENEIVRKIIRTAYMEQKVTDLDAAIEQVMKLVTDSNGYIQSSSIREYSERERVATYVLRIPEGSYDSIVMTIRQIGKNVNFNEQGQDVTEEYYDNAARIKNLKLQEEAVQKLFDKADKMEDILAIQRELTQIRGNIESLEGRNRYLDNLSSLSTIELSIREVKPLEYLQEESDSALSRAKEGFMDTLSRVGSFFVETFVFLVSAFPVLVLMVVFLGLLLWGLYRWNKKRMHALTNSMDDANNVEISDKIDNMDKANNEDK